MTNLQYAVSNADLFEDFLKKHLNVSNKNIISLQDEQALHARILSSFMLLKDNMHYKKDEAAIIIYYAGHEAQTDKPHGWQNWCTSSGCIEVLCPSDMDCPTMNDKKNQDVIRGIPNRTISALLNQISEAKGNNIVRISNLSQN